MRLPDASTMSRRTRSRNDEPSSIGLWRASSLTLTRRAAIAFSCHAQCQTASDQTHTYHQPCSCSTVFDLRQREPAKPTTVANIVTRITSFIRDVKVAQLGHTVTLDKNILRLPIRSLYSAERNTRSTVPSQSPQIIMRIQSGISINIL
jgi:hypothetical protein